MLSREDRKIYPNDYNHVTTAIVLLSAHLLAWPQQFIEEKEHPASGIRGPPAFLQNWNALVSPVSFLF